MACRKRQAIFLVVKNKNMNKTFVFSLLLLACASGCRPEPNTISSVTRVEATGDRPHRFERDVVPILERYCIDCHAAESNQGGIVLDGVVGGDPHAIDPTNWGRVADVLRSGAMPPVGQPKPDTAEISVIDEWVSNEIFGCKSPDQDAGRVTLRRLNRMEYDQTIRDLFGFDRDLKLAASFPDDDLGEGFDRLGDVLAVPPILIERYLIAADQALDEAVRSPEVWSRILNPAADEIPLSQRKPIFAVRNEPIKRIGRLEPAPPVVEDRQVAEDRRIHEIVRAFADRAFRRPATQLELSGLMGLVESARNEGDELPDAIRHALKAVLISPRFLFLVEEGSATDDGNGSSPLDDFALASRLSYFVLGGPPDDELYRLSVRGELRSGDNLARLVRRWLTSGRSKGLVDGFATQWLQLRALRSVTPDSTRFPEFDESLRTAMIEETQKFVAAIINEDHKVIEIVDADFTFMNERLARHYGINGVLGAEFRRVSLTDPRRGGILAHASVLTVNANPTRTSPVKRGRWVLDTLLGMPTLPPPEGVEGLQAIEGVAPSGSIRRQMERHRLDPACASCHSRMDPIGFGLENFDAIGAWRTTDDGQPIDASGQLPGGQPFSGFAELRVALKSRSESFRRCLAEKMLIYALGRGLRPFDRCFVDEIVRQTRRDGDRFSSLVLAIVTSPPFQSRSSGKPVP